MSRRHLSLIFLGFLLSLLLLLFFAPFFINHQVLFFADNLTLFYPIKNLIAQSWKAGQIPLWNHFIFSGTPLLADPATGSLSPFILVYLLFPTPIAITIAAIISIILLTLGTYFFAQEIGIKPTESIFAAIIFSFSGTVLSYTNNIVITETLAWLPLVLFFTFKSIKSSQFRYQAATAIFLSLQIFSGYLPLVLITAFSMVLISLTNLKLTQLFKLAKIFLLTVLLSAVQLIPALEMIHYSTRTNANSSTHQELKLTEIPRLIFGQFYGSMNQGNSWGFDAPPERGLAETIGYLGIIPLILFCLALAKKQLFLPSLTVVSLILSFGSQTPLFGLISWLPGFSLIRIHTLWLIIYSIFLSLTAAKALQSLSQHQLSRPKLFLLLGSVFVILAVISLNIFFHPQVFFNQAVTFISKFYSSINLPSHYPLEKLLLIISQINYNLTIVFLLIAALFICFALISWRLIPSKFVSLIILTLAIIDLFLLGRGSLFFAPVDLFTVSTPESHWLTDNLNNYRFLTIADTTAYTGLDPIFNQIIVREPFYESHITTEEMGHFSYLRNQISLLPPNLAIPLNLPTVNGYASLILSQYANWWEPDFSPTNKISITDFTSPKINQTGVKYLLLSAADQDIKDYLLKADWQEINLSPNQIIMENPAAYPKAFLQSTLIPAQIIGQTLGQFLVATQSDTSDYLIITNTNYPGWKAMVNNQPQSIEPYEQIFQKIKIPPGTNLVTLKFSPQPFFLGLIISLTTLALLLHLTKSHPNW